MTVLHLLMEALMFKRNTQSNVATVFHLLHHIKCYLVEETDTVKVLYLLLVIDGEYLSEA